MPINPISRKGTRYAANSVVPGVAAEVGAAHAWTHQAEAPRPDSKRVDYKGLWAAGGGGMMAHLRGQRWRALARGTKAAGSGDEKVRPDKQKVVDEVWDDVRIRGFLDKAPLGEGVDPDHSALVYAYRSMRPEDFKVFIEHFTGAGRDLDARGEAGETLMELIANHRRAEPFRRILEDARRRPPA